MTVIAPLKKQTGCSRFFAESLELTALKEFLHNALKKVFKFIFYVFLHI